ncbi:Ead domain protein [Klebsiella oxytoca]|uniref:ead/Ea22-like family protein n=1 Tax=Klebsiella oxytoca TaxID=571 RepID=UPI0007CCA3BE|nr:ead/Ea22-like family protein [Klebsiella oxytoca]SAQ00743.1 Ead domain protein [Klebsiella oxytoca]
MIENTEITAEKLEEIRQRYRPTEVPECHICGAEMTIQRMSASRITYGCAGAIYDETGCHYAEGRSLADDHYAESRITLVDVSDPDIIALVEALDKSEKTSEARREAIDRTHNMFVRERDRANAAEEALEKAQTERDEFRRRFNLERSILEDADKDLETLRQRIAELESRTVKLPKRSVGEVMHMSGFSRDYAEGWCAGNDNEIHEIHNSGIKVEG